MTDDEIETAIRVTKAMTKEDWVAIARVFLAIHQRRAAELEREQEQAEQTKPARGRPTKTDQQAQTAGPQQLIPIARAAEQLGYTNSSIYRFASLGRIQLMSLSGRTFVEAQELERFRRDNVKPFVPGERIIANAGGHRPPVKKAKKPQGGAR